MYVCTCMNHMLNISLKVDSQNWELSQVQFWHCSNLVFCWQCMYKIIVDNLTSMLMDKVERWTVTLKVDVQSFNDCATKYKVEEWNTVSMFAKLIFRLIFVRDGTPSSSTVSYFLYSLKSSSSISSNNV